jgi:DNA-binding PucR family transcriptional regulator
MLTGGSSVADQSMWVRALRPVDDAALSRSVLAADRLAKIIDLFGPGPVGWSVELAEGMTREIVSEIPELGVDVVIHEVHRGCEAVAVTMLAILAKRIPFAADEVVEVLAGPGELVGRGVGIEHMIRSIHIGHGYASAAFFTAVEALIPVEDRFAEVRRISELLFAAVDQLTAAMASEFSTVQKSWLASTAAVRLEIVHSVLRGEPVPLDRSGRTLGYDLTRYHSGLVVWTDDPAAPAPGQLEQIASDVLKATGHSGSLILPVGARRVWAWGSRLRSSPGSTHIPAQPPPGTKVAIGLPAPGVAGFRASHEQALAAAAFGMNSRSGQWLFDYADVDMLVMLSAQADLARQFVRRELGGLAGPEDTAVTLRATLKCYLDTERSLSAAADKLHVARNTVAYRVQRAEQLRGRPIDSRRMQLQAALALAEELGDTVLGDSADT